MQRIDHLVFEEPPCDTEVYVGQFLYIDPHGEETVADFYIRCCAEIDGPEEFEEESAYLRRYRREVEFNAQWAHQFDALERSGCKNVRFEAVRPCPIL